MAAKIMKNILQYICHNPLNVHEYTVSELYTFVQESFVSQNQPVNSDMFT